MGPIEIEIRWEPHPRGVWCAWYAEWRGEEYGGAMSVPLERVGDPAAEKAMRQLGEQTMAKVYAAAQGVGRSN